MRCFSIRGRSSEIMLTQNTADNPTSRATDDEEITYHVSNGYSLDAIARFAPRLQPALLRWRERMDGLPRAWRIVEGKRLLVTLCPAGGYKAVVARSAQPTSSIRHPGRSYMPSPGWGSGLGRAMPSVI